MSKATTLLLVLTAAWAASAGAGAAEANDPTRPPAALFAPAAASGPARGASGAAPHAEPAPLRVQSIQLNRDGASTALVDGHLLRVGDKLGGSVIAAIDAQGVQLRGARGNLERLPLIDAQVVKQPVYAAGAATTPVASLAGGKQP